MNLKLIFSKINKRSLFIYIISIFMLTSVSCIAYFLQNQNEIITAANDIDSTIAIHIKGAIKNPGYYEIPYGSRVNDAIKFAGGSFVDADLDAINLARTLIDGEELIIPYLPESFDSSLESFSLNDADTSSDFVSKTALNTFSSSSSDDVLNASKSFDGKININTATSSQLQKLDGIGEILAKRIIDYRNLNGPFSTIEEIKMVDGIGDGRFNKIKNSITVK